MVKFVPPQKGVREMCCQCQLVLESGVIPAVASAPWCGLGPSHAATEGNCPFMEKLHRLLSGEEQLNPAPDCLGGAHRLDSWHSVPAVCEAETGAEHLGSFHCPGKLKPLLSCQVCVQTALGMKRCQQQSPHKANCLIIC